MSVIDENWVFDLNMKSLESKRNEMFQNKVKNLYERVSGLVDGFNAKKFNYNGNNEVYNHDNELKSLIDQNKVLRHDIDVKVTNLSLKKTQYESYKKDQRLLSQEIKETHEAFLMAKKYYKKFLKIYYTIESKNGLNQTLFVQFFTEAKKESDNYSVQLLRDTKTEHYKLLETTPKLHIFKELQQQLEITNDVPGMLCCIRSAFMNMKTNKKYGLNAKGL